MPRGSHENMHNQLSCPQRPGFTIRSECENSHVRVAAGTQHVSVLNVEKAGKLSIISCTPQHINNAYNCSVILQEQYIHMLRHPNVKRDTVHHRLGLSYNKHLHQPLLPNNARGNHTIRA